ncbi:POT family proton-dependent oligopeptide transporter [Altererythrobacter atlanticus]|uniref:Dipeptide and tripeptide permease YjdL n=1 Tax=Croceibacterium atlanticum TaxID=1267766 RepID=A0A0F7KVE0_9SPHN|nr:oligopeptide:H+ symporter [Croceibacterium atlanticum]AKH43202.1 putative dipeptide and tripeptide permease YjdL [Croceibacterium atlanticum]MBB5732093.1 POT family proton-dependent oligopeptide transporter [Croceibacterium atlanticum]
MKDIALWDEGDWIAAIAAVTLFAVLVIGGMIAARRSQEVVGHPRGLFVLFYTEMWERFSYYGMRALLILYLTKHWLFEDGKASLIYGAYTSLVYITPVLGGWLADRYLGQRKAVLFGGLLLALGHGFMAFEGDGSGFDSDPTISIFWLALSFIIVGSGFLKANISVIVGQLYGITDERRDSAYTIFYMGINTGAALGTILVGYLGETIGWGYGFGLAGIGMVLGLIIFAFGKPALMGQGEPPAPLAKVREYSLYGVGVAAVAGIWFLIQYQNVVGTLLGIAGIILLGYVLFEAFKMEKHPRERIFAIIFLVALQPLFWGLFEQAGGSLNLFTDRYVDRGGVPASLFQSINAIFIVLLGPIFASLWIFLSKRNIEPSTPAKFGLGIVQVGLGFLVFTWGANALGGALVPVFLVFLIYFLHTSGELCLSPVGLSAMNRLAPKHMASLIMGAWFFMTAWGNFVAGKIGEATGGGEGGEMTKEGTLAIYTSIGWLAVGIGVVVMLLAPLVKRWMHLDTLNDDNVGDDLLGADEAGEPQGPGIHPATRPLN